MQEKGGKTVCKETSETIKLTRFLKLNVKFIFAIKKK